jgi:hypothetical protein
MMLLGCPPQHEITICNNSGEDHIVLANNKWLSGKKEAQLGLDRMVISIGLI